MASSSENKQKFFSNGSITELFSFRSGIVILMDYDENQTLRILGIGQFMVYLMMHVFYPIMITVCSINDFHWPLTKDTVIFRMANRTFAFALPGLLYGLQFPPFCEDSMMDALENLFMKFGYYCKVMGDKGLGYCLNDEDPLLWYKIRNRFEAKANELLIKLGQLPGKSRYNMLGYNPSHLRAIRMSAATKVVEDGMINSGILKDKHFAMIGTNPPNSNPNANDLIDQYTAYASVSVITCLVDALESAEILMVVGLDYLTKGIGVDDEPRLQTIFDKIRFKVWRMNEIGVAHFIPQLGPAVEQEKHSMKKKKEEWERVMKEASITSGDTSGSTTSGVAPPSDKGKGIMP